MSLDSYLLLFVSLYTLISIVKNIVIGKTFSIRLFILYRDDYIKWYTFRQKYIPAKERIKFNKKNINNN